MTDKLDTGSAAAIREAAFLEQSLWTERNDEMDLFQELVELELWPDLETGVPIVQDNSPWVTTRYAIGQMQTANRRWEAAQRGKHTPKDRDLEARIERWLMGAWQSVDERRLEGLAGSWQFDLMAFMFVFGWYACVPTLDIDKDGNVIPDVMLYDPRTVYPVEAGGKVIRVYRVQPTTLLDVEYQYNVELDGRPTDSIEIIELFDATDHVVVASQRGQTLDKYYDTPLRSEKHGFGAVPMFVGPVGGFPFRNPTAGNDSDHRQKIGMSGLYGIRNVYTRLNTLYSMSLQAASDYAIPATVFETPEQTPRDLEVGKAKQVNITPGEKVSPLRMPGQGPDFGFMAQSLAGMMQRGTISNLQLGQAQERMTGIAASQMMAASAHVFAPYIQMQERIDRRVGETWLRLYEKYGTKKGRKVRASVMTWEAGALREVELKPNELKGSYGHRVIVDVKQPADEAMKVAVTEVLVRTGVASMRWCRENIWKMQDPDKVQREVVEEYYENSDQIKLLKYMDWLRRTNQRELMAMMQQVMGGGQQAPGPAPSAVPQLSPAALSPEAQGGGVPPGTQMPMQEGESAMRQSARVASPSRGLAGPGMME